MLSRKFRSVINDSVFHKKVVNFFLTLVRFLKDFKNSPKGDYKLFKPFLLQSTAYIFFIRLQPHSWSASATIWWNTKLYSWHFTPTTFECPLFHDNLSVLLFSTLIWISVFIILKIIEFSNVSSLLKMLLFDYLNVADSYFSQLV